MAPLRALVVDDQHAVREVLRDGLLSLDAAFEVTTVPSGEEALLEASGGDVDLLVADVHLPGISGLDLIRRMRARYPDMKVILITGLTDPAVRRQVADAGADAFFLKPIELADFLDTVERMFGLVETFTAEPSLESTPVPRASVADYLASLRQELNAISAVLLDADGRVLVQAGDLPDAIQQTSLISRLMAAFSASEQISAFLKQSKPQDLLAFGGQKYDLFFSHVGKRYALLLIVNRGPSETVELYFARIGGRMQAAVGHLEHILRELGVAVHGEETEEAEAAEATADVLGGSLEPVVEELLDEELSSLLESASVGVDPDSFWESLAAEQVALDGELLGADVITYDQAQQLGLAPSDDEEDLA